MTRWIGRRQTGHGRPRRLSRRAQLKQQVWWPLDPCTMLASLGADRQMTHRPPPADDDVAAASFGNNSLQDGRSLDGCEYWLAVLLQGSLWSRREASPEFVVHGRLWADCCRVPGVRLKVGFGFHNRTVAGCLSWWWAARMDYSATGSQSPGSKTEFLIRQNLCSTAVITGRWSVTTDVNIGPHVESGLWGDSGMQSTAGRSGRVWSKAGGEAALLGAVGSQSGLRVQQKSQYLCSGQLLLLQFVQTHLSWQIQYSTQSTKYFYLFIYSQTCNTFLKTIKTGYAKQHEAGYAERVKRHLRQNLKWKCSLHCLHCIMK